MMRETVPMRVRLPGDLYSLPVKFLISKHCPSNLLGADILSALQAEIRYQNGEIHLKTNSSLLNNPQFLAALTLAETFKNPAKYDELWCETIPAAVWSQGKTDVGLLNTEPVSLKLKPHTVPFTCKQYPLSQDQMTAISIQITEYLKIGVLRECRSPWNTPLFPVKKKIVSGTVQYRMVHDLRELNKRLIVDAPIVPNPHTLLNDISPEADCFSTIDLANAFFSVPLEEESQPYTAFTFDGKQYCWTRLPQGGATSPSAFSEALQKALQGWLPEQQSTQLLQYVDDLLVCAKTIEGCKNETRSLLIFLGTIGCKVSKEKLCVAQAKVIFLGHCISHGTKHLTEERKQAILQFTVPKTIKKMRAFLGVIGYCREWIPQAASLLDPLYETTKGVSQGSLQLTKEQREAFQTAKQAVVSSPALGLPNYKLPFTLYCHEQTGYAHGVLTQIHGGKQRPLAYYSLKLDPVIRGSPSCVRAVAAAAVLKGKIGDIILDHPLTIQVPHSVTEILNQARTRHLSAARLTKYEVALLSPTNLTVKRCTVLNPATLLPQDEDSKGGSREDNNDCEDSEGSDGDETDKQSPTKFFSHNCIELMQQESVGLANIEEDPIPNADLELFVDGSRYYHEGSPRVGYAVTTGTEILVQKSLNPGQSAQEAELQALAEACILAENQTANIYTDSRYAYGVAHDFGPIWKSRDYLGANGRPIKHAGLISLLFRALEAPKKVAILKVKAHTKYYLVVHLRQDVIFPNN